MIKAKRDGRSILFDWLFRNGWEKDRYGNFKKGNYRVKMQENSARYEFKNSLGQWQRLRSCFYSKLSINEDGQLCGLPL